MRAVEDTRQEWAEGHRAFVRLTRDPIHEQRLHVQLEAVGDELRRRVGQTFSLTELVAAYADADRWTREAVERTAPAPGWPRTLAIVGDAAFHLYSRGARDYAL